MKKLTTIALLGTALSVFSPNIQAQQNTYQNPTSQSRITIEQKQKRQEELVKEIAKIIEKRIAEAGRTLTDEEQGEFRNDAFNMMAKAYYTDNLSFDETIKYVEQNLKAPPPKETTKLSKPSIVQRLENEKKAQENAQRNYVIFCDDIKDDLNNLIDKYWSYHRLIQTSNNVSNTMLGIDKQYANVKYCFENGYTKQQTLEYIENRISKSVTDKINEKYLSHLSKYSDKGMHVAKIIMEKYEPLRKYEKKQSFTPGRFRYPLLDQMVNKTDSIISNEFYKNFMTISDQDFNEYFNYMLEYISKNVHAPTIEKGAQPKVIEEYFSPKVYNPEITQNR